MKKKVVLALSLVLMLLLMPTSVFADSNRISFEEYLLQKGIDSQDPEIAIKLMQDAKLQMEKQISPPESSVGTRSWSNVVLGTDTVFYTADAGNKGSGRSGLATGVWDSGYFTATRKAEAVVYVGPMGWGNAWAWANLGKLFYTSGGGSQAANIRFLGDYDGLLWVLASASTQVEIKGILWDYTTSSITSMTILSANKSLAGMQEYVGQFNQNLPVVLQSGHDYCAYIQVETNVGYYVFGGGSSDFGTQDSDPGYTRYSSITIDF